MQGTAVYSLPGDRKAESAGIEDDWESQIQAYCQSIINDQDDVVRV